MQELQVVEQDWVNCGKWSYRLRYEAFRIFPKNKEGESIPVWVRRSFLEMKTDLKDGSAAVIVVKYFKHRRQFYWSDSRQKGSQPRHQIKSEVARLLFQGNRELADRLLKEVESAIK